MINTFVDYLTHSTIITIFIFFVLSIYFIITIWIFIYKTLELNSFIKKELNSLNTLFSSDLKLNPISTIGLIVGNRPVDKDILNMCEITLIREATSNLSWLSIVASTAPFIGLFGTVVGILESFASFQNISKISFSTIAPVISEALIATAAGIFVAIFAYTFHQILIRKIYLLNTYITSQIHIILSRS